MTHFSAANKVDYNKIFNELMKNLSPIFSQNVPQIFLKGKLENFLICRRLSEYMRENNLMSEKAANFFEETSLIAVHQVFFHEVNLVDVHLLIAELPEILKLNYPAVKDIRTACIEIIPQMLDIYRSYDANSWKKFVDLKYLVEMLKVFDDVKK